MFDPNRHSLPAPLEDDTMISDDEDEEEDEAAPAVALASIPASAHRNIVLPPHPKVKEVEGPAVFSPTESKVYYGNAIKEAMALFK